MSEKITENLHYKLRVWGLKNQGMTKDVNGCIKSFWNLTYQLLYIRYISGTVLWK